MRQNNRLAKLGLLLEFTAICNQKKDQSKIANKKQSFCKTKNG
jgi:hypothetical protein